MHKDGGCLTDLSHTVVFGVFFYFA